MTYQSVDTTNFLSSSTEPDNVTNYLRHLRAKLKFRFRI